MNKSSLEKRVYFTGLILVVLLASFSVKLFHLHFSHKIKIKDDEVHPRELQKLIADIDGEGYERVVNKMMLRSLKQARYSPECLGHFGLAAKYKGLFGGASVTDIALTNDKRLQSRKRFQIQH